MEEKTAVQKLLNGANATLAMDGWSTITNEPVIGVCIISSYGSFLVDTADTTGAKHTGNFLTQYFEKHKKKCEEEWGVKITSVVTDNASNMVCMRNNHRNTGNRMDSTEVSKGMECLRQCDESILPEVTKFLPKSPPHMAYLCEKQ